MAQRLREPDAEGCRIEICGNRVRIRYKYREHELKLSVGMRYIIELISHAGIPVSLEALMSISSSIHASYICMGSKDALAEHGLSSLDSFMAMPMTDVSCIRQVKERLMQIVAELAEMEQHCNYARADDLRDEQDALASYLREVYRPDKRIRNFTTEMAKQRFSIVRAIKRALQSIYEADAELGDKLKASIKLGKYPVYNPTELDVSICRV
jgi:hypothetical protein